MFNFKALSIAAALTFGSIFGYAIPATAGSCWMGNPGERMERSWCSVKYRVNANGHNVIDIVDDTGSKGTVVLWEGGTAELIYKGQVRNVRWYRDRDGDVRLSGADGKEFAFRS